MELERRRIATQKTLDAWRGRTFDWATGSTCAHLAHDHLTNLGHDLPPMPAFTTSTGAIRALKERGWSTVEEMLDSLLEPIAPARMLVGDIGIIPGQDGLESIVISTGFKMMAWHQDGRFVLSCDGIEALQGAWRG